MRANFKKNKIIFAIFLIIFGAIGRILLKDLPNIETVTVASILAGSVLGGAYAIIVPLTIIALSDMFIGNDPILIFTWSAWAAIGLSAKLLYQKRKNTYKFVFQLTGLGILASLFFYFWTNFGVWLLWSMYPHNLSGLIQCYFMGLPFLRNNLISDFVFIPVAGTSLVFCVKYFEKQKIKNLCLQIKNIVKF